MASRTFTVFQDVPATEAIKAKPVTSNVMATRSSARLRNILQGSSSSLHELIPADKENVHPVTGERAGNTAASKKRKTNGLSAKSPTPLAAKRVKSTKKRKDAQPQSKKRKATSEVEESEVTSKREGKPSGTSRKSLMRVTRKVPKLPRLEEEVDGKDQETKPAAEVLVDSLVYDLTVWPLADVSQAYEVVKILQDASDSPPSKAKFRKDTSAEPEISDFFPTSQTTTSLASTSTGRTPSSEPTQSRRFSTPELKRICAGFTFSSPSASERFKSSCSSSAPRSESP